MITNGDERSSKQATTLRWHETKQDLEARPGVFVHPGGLFVTRDAGPISTIVGSCVAVCLSAPLLRVGGLNHFLMPEQTADTDPLRYGDSSTELLIQELLGMGCVAAALRAKVFGGATIHTRDSGDSLGARNVIAAMRVLRSYGIQAVLQDVGGGRGRKLTFFGDTGEHDVSLL